MFFIHESVRSQTFFKYVWEFLVPMQMPAAKSLLKGENIFLRLAWFSWWLFLFIYFYLCFFCSFPAFLDVFLVLDNTNKTLAVFGDLLQR